MTIQVPRATLRALSAMAMVLLCVLFALPAYAEPPTTSVPDGGARPVPATPITPPGGSVLPGAPPSSPLADQIATETAAVELIGEQLKQVDIDLERAHKTTLAA